MRGKAVGEGAENGTCQPGGVTAGQMGVQIRQRSQAGHARSEMRKATSPCSFT
jgi:hypothetical protein